MCAGIEENQNGVDSNVGEDSDSLGNSKSSKTSITPPTKEKRKPFFKKVSGGQGCYFSHRVCILQFQVLVVMRKRLYLVPQFCHTCFLYT